MNRMKYVAIGTILFLAGAALAPHLIELARAAVGPTTDPLSYSGVLEDDGGQVSGQRDIEIHLWTDGESTSASARACSTVARDTAVTAGRFRVVLDEECATAVRRSGDLWAEVIVDALSLGRAKLGAVPYALNDTYVNPETGRGQSDGSYCGDSGATSGDVTGGYAGAKQMCEAACDSPTAHVCSVPEAVRHLSTGGTFPNWGRVITGMASYDSDEGNSNHFTDCEGFTSSDGLRHVTTGYGPGAKPAFSNCSAVEPFLCCD